MLSKKILSLHHKSIIVDGHADTFGKILETNGDFFKLGKAVQSHKGWTHLDFPRMKKGGLDLQFMAIYTPPKYKSADATLYALKMLTVIKKAVKESNGKIILIQSAGDLKELNNKKGFLINIESGSPLDGNITLLEMFYRLGVRAMGLTHNPGNELGDGLCIKNPHGLTTFGKQVVRKMNQLGMIIDVAHLSKPGFYDVLRHSNGPIISSHTGVRKLCNVFRNLDDDQIKQIAERKGVVGIFYIPEFIKSPTQRFISYQGMKKVKWATILKSTTVKDVINHIQYVADKFGVDYVGLGSDFDGYDGVIKGLEDTTRLPNITAELANRGFNQTAIKKILGGNFLRVIIQTIHS